MKMPRRPPDSKKMSEFCSNPLKFNQIQDEGIKTEREGKYRHWDILRHLTPPLGLTLEEWWTGIKMHRLMSYKEVPLQGVKKSEIFYYNLTDAVMEEMHFIDIRAGGSVNVPDDIVSPHTRDQFLVRSLMEESITSSQIEGAATTRAIAKEMLKSGRSPRDISEQMIFNNFHTMQRIQEWKEHPMTKELLLEIHRTITQDTLQKSDAVGRFRNNIEVVVVEDFTSGEILHTPPLAEDLDRRIELMCDFANGKTPSHFIHPIIRAIILHFWLAYEHPFVDGNGRAARTLFYWMMIRHSYELFEFISISEIILKAPKKYAEAFLFTETDQNDLTYFILHQVDVIKSSIKTLYSYIEKKKIDLKTIDSLLKNKDILNARQEALLSHALKHPGASYTIQAHKTSQRIAYDTARHDLLLLHEIGLLEMIKKGKAYIFLSPLNLPQILKARLSH